MALLATDLAVDAKLEIAPMTAGAAGAVVAAAAASSVDTTPEAPRPPRSWEELLEEPVLRPPFMAVFAEA